MKRVKLTKHNLEQVVAMAVEFLIDGGVVLLPTDTSYGLAADAAREEAVEAVAWLKGRPGGKAFSVVTAGKRQAEALTEFSPAAAKLWDAFLPGPLTLVLPVSTGAGLAPGCISNGKIGIRYPDHPFPVQVAERLERPYTATSANRSGQPPAFRVSEFLDSLTDGSETAGAVPDLVVDAGALPIRPVSTVVEVSDGAATVLREGAIPEADIKSALE